MSSSDKQFRIWGIVALVVFVSLVTLLSLRWVGFGVRSSRGFGYSYSTGSSKYKIAVIEVAGPILESEPVLKRIQMLDDESAGVQGVILHINSPGGVVGPSQEIYEALDLLRQEHHWKIYASMESVGASGAYWISLVADKIYANAGTLTGSIGALMELVNLQELFQWIKVKPETLKAGKYKDIGSANRPMTTEERQMLQSVLDDIHDQFRSRVEERRGIHIQRLAGMTEGQVFTGRQALKLGLIDALGGFQKVVQDMTDELKIPRKPSLYYPEPPMSWPELIQHLGQTSLSRFFKALTSDTMGVR